MIYGNKMQNTLSWVSVKDTLIVFPEILNVMYSDRQAFEKVLYIDSLIGNTTFMSELEVIEKGYRDVNYEDYVDCLQAASKMYYGLKEECN